MVGSSCAEGTCNLAVRVRPEPVGELMEKRDRRNDAIELYQLAVAHKPNEFVPINEFVDASLIYRDIALQMLHERGATR